MSSNYGSSGSPFDQLEIFTFEEAARALVFDRTGQIVPALASRLTPLGNEFHDWIAVLKDAFYADTNPLCVSIYSEEAWRKHGLKACVISREQLRDWCSGRGMRPKFLTPEKEAASSANKETPPERKARLLKEVESLGGRTTNGALKPGILDKLAVSEGVSKSRIKQLISLKQTDDGDNTSLLWQLGTANKKR